MIGIKPVRERSVATKLQQMPPEFLVWQCDDRHGAFAAMGRGEVPRSLAAHLPVLSTLNEPGAAFPIRSCTKGVGLLPRQEYLAEHLTSIVDCLRRCQQTSGSESLSDRIGTAMSLYARPERIDPTVFGAIEIFEGTTYENLRRDPRATLLFTGSGPGYLSYQVDCSAEILGPEDPRFEFLLGMRSLFEKERFHIQQPRYPLGYLFYIQEIIEKTPRRRGRAQCPHSASGSHPFRDR